MPTGCPQQHTAVPARVHDLAPGAGCGAAARLRMMGAMRSPASSRSAKLAQIWRSTGPGRYSFRSNTCRGQARAPC